MRGLLFPAATAATASRAARACRDRPRTAAATLALLVATAACAADPPKPAARPALSVQVVQPQKTALSVRVAAVGSIAAWEEASIGTEASNLRLADVRVNVGDVVRRGQVLATFAPETMQVDLAQARAAVVEAEATLAEAAANAERARSLEKTGALSEATIAQYTTAERTARARVDAQRALLRARQLRVAQTSVVAPDDGVVSSRSATVGAVLPAGQELFRMIRKGRLEWRAEVAAADLARLAPGMKATVSVGAGDPVEGTVRKLAPTVDPKTRNGLVYVDLPSPGAARAGMFARGEFDAGSGSGLTVPQSAVSMREGFAYVFVVGEDGRVHEQKVQAGRRSGDRVEITGGLAAGARVVAAGGAFLAEGDAVRVVPGTP